MAISSAAGYGDDCVLMLKMNGADASTSFIDFSLSEHPITPNGNAQIDTAQSKFGGASALFDGAGDYLSIPDSGDWDLGTDDFTIDFWLRFNAVATNMAIFDLGDSQNQNDGIFLGMGNTSQLEIVMKDAGSTSGLVYVKSLASAMSNGQWYHIAIVRNGSSIKLFRDGVEQDPGDTNSNDVAITGAFLIGKSNFAGKGDLNGWIDEFRLVKGQAIWTAGFTPPAKAYVDLNTEYAAIAEYTTGRDANLEIGCGGAGCATSTRRGAQSFQLASEATVVAAELYLQLNTGANGITVRIETDNADKPSGTLVDANATFAISHAEIPASFDWVRGFFPAEITLSPSTKYWLVARRTTESGADQNYAWGKDSSSPSYADGNASQFVGVVGVTAWSGETGSDALFKILGNEPARSNNFFASL